VARKLTDRLLSDLAEAAGRSAHDRGVSVAVAESLTGGAIAQQLAKAADAGDWFAGGVVAYRNETKYRVLAVPEGPVVSPGCARAMALGVLYLTDADAAVAVTGVGGPGPEEGQAAGTVFLATATREGVHDVALTLGGGPEEVVASTVEHALRHLADAIVLAGERRSA
jgi:nicotinamide-nucleotide amidase